MEAQHPAAQQGIEPAIASVADLLGSELGKHPIGEAPLAAVVGPPPEGAAGFTFDADAAGTEKICGDMGWFGRRQIRITFGAQARPPSG